MKMFFCCFLNFWQKMPLFCHFLQQDAKHSALAFVDNASKRFSHFSLSVGRHRHDFCANAVINKREQTFSKKIGLPNALWVAFKLLCQICDKVLALAFVPNKWCHLRFNVHFDDVQAWRGRLDFHAIFSALLNKFWLI